MFGKSILGNLIESSEREYLYTNGIGGFAATALNGGLSRRYHGLLIASLKPPLDRYIVLHNIEESINGISTAFCRKKTENGYSVMDGNKYLDSYTQQPFPKFVYTIGGNVVSKEIFTVYGKNCVVVKYTLLSSVKESISLGLDIFLNNRDFHSIGTLKNTDEIKTVSIAAKEVSYDFGNLIGTASLKFTMGKYEEKNELRKDISLYIEEEHRGEFFYDTSLHKGTINAELREGEEIYVTFALGGINVPPKKLMTQELNRIKQLKKNAGKKDLFFQDLAVAADTFIVIRESTSGMTVLAGYPWFGDWGRDTMIALTGLTLSTNRPDDAASILKTFAKYCSEGMLPNKFPDYDGEPLMYNTIDASMWYFHAIDKYIKQTSDYDLVKNVLWSSMKEIIEYHIRGTRYNIKADETDGLIFGGDDSTQLTWMDAKYEGWAVTPRFGKAVEINALWYNALIVMKILGEKFGEDTSVYEKYAEKVKANYENVFWNEELKCLYDYIAGDNKISDIRPNQIFAVSLPHSLLSPEKEKMVVDKVTEKLYTPHGLRSIAQDDPKFIGIYKGTLFQRDSCYHQGTVWSWPLGHFISAHKKVYNNIDKLNYFIDGMKSHFYQEACINNISEIFDGSEPNKARGCYAQAWSVAEIIRVLKEDINVK